MAAGEQNRQTEITWVIWWLDGVSFLAKKKWESAQILRKWIVGVTDRLTVSMDSWAWLQDLESLSNEKVPPRTVWPHGTAFAHAVLKTYVQLSCVSFDFFRRVLPIWGQDETSRPWAQEKKYIWMLTCGPAVWRHTMWGRGALLLSVWLLRFHP